MRQALGLAFLVWLGAGAADLGARENEGEYEAQVAGTRVECKDIRGVPVRVVSTTDVGDVARAWLVNRIPMILLDRNVMATIPPKMQLFFYGHECAHHVLGHTFLMTTTRETEADCWSIKFGRAQGYFGRADVEGFAPYLAGSRGSPVGHLPGPERAKHLVACFDEP